MMLERSGLEMKKIQLMKWLFLEQTGRVSTMSTRNFQLRLVLQLYYQLRNSFHSQSILSFFFLIFKFQFLINYLSFIHSSLKKTPLTLISAGWGDRAGSVREIHCGPVLHGAHNWRVWQEIIETSSQTSR